MTAKPEHYDVIRKPIITEKATMASEFGAVVFEVQWMMISTMPATIATRPTHVPSTARSHDLTHKQPTPI